MKNIQTKFPDLLKLGLKVGQEINSYMYGKGVVHAIQGDSLDDYPIMVRFEDFGGWFSTEGFQTKECQFPSIHLSEWNPLKEPFPMPKFEPVKGEVYAFWDTPSHRFAVSKFAIKTIEGYRDEHNTAWLNCAPIEEALEIFGFKKDSHEL